MVDLGLFTELSFEAKANHFQGGRSKTVESESVGLASVSYRTAVVLMNVSVSKRGGSK